ncbi:MAG: tyrosinase family protein [Bryobacteraceae bacterium]
MLYQAWLHDFYCTGGAQGTGVHATWDFLPWHRGFLCFHELILADAARCPEFRLPVWDWEKSLEMPPFFCELGLPSFLTGGYLRVLDVSDTKTSFSQCALQGWLLSNRFEDFCGAASSPAGGDPPRSSMGPHNVVHTGLVRGAMSLPMTAAADPLFYAHHANVDRFWSYWLKHYKDDPDIHIPETWKLRRYCFYDAQGQPVSVQAGQLLVDSDLGYSYREPKLDLYPFSAITPDSVHPAQLVDQLEAALCGNLIERRSIDLETGATDPPGMLAAFSRYATSEVTEGARKLPEELDPVKDSLMFPLLIQAEAEIQPGKYYLLQVKNGVGSSRRRIGGFGLFSHPHGGRQATEVAVAACLDADFFDYIRQGQGHLELVYAEADPNDARAYRTGTTKSFLKAKVQFIAPKKAYSDGQIWLKTQSLRLPGLGIPRIPIP